MRSLAILCISSLSLLSPCHGFQSIASRTSHQIPTSASPRQGNRGKSIQLYYRDDSDQDRRNIEMANSFLKASRSSFKHVETVTDDLLDRQPLIALGIFVGMGLLVAYISGFVFLGGYIETWNPAENDAIPYWDDEVLIVTRVVGR